jgi:hypothetical protein
VGLDGIVLASRFWYLLVAGAAGYLAYRALRVRLPPVAAATGVAVALVPTPYNLLLISYNTVPALALLVATSAAFAVIAVGSTRWAMVCGAALVVAVFSHIAVAPGALLTLVLVVALARVSGHGRAARAALGAAVVGGVVVVGWMLVRVGIGAVVDTYRYTTDYQSLRPSPLTRLRGFVRDYAETLFHWSYLPLGALVVAAVAPGRRVVQVLATLAIPLAAAVPSAAVAIWGDDETVGVTIGTYATITALALAAPVTAWAMRGARPWIRLLVLLTLPLAVVNVAFMAMTTSASPYFGTSVGPIVPFLGTAAAAMVLMAEELGTGGRVAEEQASPRGSRRGAHVSRVAAAMVVVVFAGVQFLHSFRTGEPWDATTRVDSGPNAGLSTTASLAHTDAEINRVVASHVGPDDSVLYYALPSGYLASDAPMDTNILWLGRFRAANQETLDWMERTDRHPTVVMVPAGVVEGAGGWEGLAGEDPLIARVLALAPEPTADGRFFVLRPRWT